MRKRGERWLRVPISYALKLSLADLAGVQPHMPERMRAEAERLLRYFSNDNTSPETTSFHIITPQSGSTTGEQVARESARRFLFTSLLMSWANQRFGLAENGQRGMVYHAPHPPVRQTELSSCISDAFYRELFMSPCLSGWEDGEAKADYMHLCHQVLSRSQLNSVAKLREAGIIANNLVVLPSLSNVSLANNGIHVSMGSRALTRAVAELDRSDALAEEKRLGDLAIKIFEHFLPLFVGTYSAAPYRIDFAQFHPERLLAFLPHELDFTHLRLMWREWREKAKLRVFGRPATPYGPLWLDTVVAGLFRLRGDLVPDYRLINYPVAWLSSEHTSALDGTPGNLSRLASELDEMGVVDRRMSFYMPLRLREFGCMGFSGFEARYYSLFPSYTRDLAPAIDLQQLLLRLAYQLAVSEAITAEQIPDDPTSESERRQPFFFAAAGLPAFYVHKNSRNQLLRSILRHCTKTRSSWRHPDYLRVSIRDYRAALLAYLEETAQDAIDTLAAEHSHFEWLKLSVLVIPVSPLRVLRGSRQEFLGWTPGFVKLRVPPRQSRGNSHFIRRPPRCREHFPAWIQAHGHAQVLGWIGSFILGIGFYSIPKLRGGLKPFRSLVGVAIRLDVDGRGAAALVGKRLLVEVAPAAACFCRIGTGRVPHLFLGRVAAQAAG